MKTNKMKNMAHSCLWTLAIILEWANVVLFMAAMGFEYNIEIYMKIRNFPNIATIYYILAGIDIIAFFLLTIINKKEKQDKNMLVALYCGLVQIALLMYKIKL